jgi:hypothetical protein
MANIETNTLRRAAEQLLESFDAIIVQCGDDMPKGWLAAANRMRHALATREHHHPDCNWWKWDWRYSWSELDCTCAKVGAADHKEMCDGQVIQAAI